MDEHVKALREDIIRKFCRTILWIDDEIHSGESQMPQLFVDKLAEFERNHLLCHLKGFPHSSGTSDFYDNSADEASRLCVQLARQADILIIDWKLGDVNSSQHAVKIVKQLLGNTEGFRFIVILSKDAPEDSAFSGLDNTFTTVSEDGCLWKNAAGQFLLSLRKDEFVSANLFDEICKSLLAVYSDYLHLVALEMAGRIKEIVPRWFASITSKADVGILLERGNTMKDDVRWRDDLQECIAGNLMDDLGSVVLSADFSSLRADVLKPSNNPTLQLPEGNGDVGDALNGLRACLKDDNPVEFSHKDYKKLFAGCAEQRIHDVVDGIEAFTEFCEKRSGAPAKAEPVPGAVYQGMVDDTTDIAVCITGGCDCLRSQTLMFLVGKELTGSWFEQLKNTAYRGGKTVLRFNGKAYIFCGQASSVLWRNRAAVCEMKPVGIFRRDILDRLVSRFMSHVRRVAVNQPTVSRRLRGEKGDEA